MCIPLLRQPIYSIYIFEYSAHEKHIISYVHLKEDCVCVLYLSVQVCMHTQRPRWTHQVSSLPHTSSHHHQAGLHLEPEAPHPTRLTDRKLLGLTCLYPPNTGARSPEDSNSGPNACRARTLTHWAVSTAQPKAFSPKNVFYICTCLVFLFCWRIFDGCFRPNCLENKHRNASDSKPRRPQRKMAKERKLK